VDSVNVPPKTGFASKRSVADGTRPLLVLLMDLQNVVAEVLVRCKCLQASAALQT